MKKPLLIGVSALTLLAVSATLFAQTSTGSSIITEMKAGVRAFTLTADLNPGVTGLQSAPLTGKKTGDQLSAGEYNRLLELVAQGGGGGGSGWVDVPLTGTENFDGECEYRLRSNGGQSWIYVWQVGPDALWFKVSTHSDDYIASIPKSEKGYWDYHVNGDSGVKYQNNVNPVNQLQKRCGGVGGGSSQSNIIKGVTSAGFTNGQPHSTMATVSFGRACANPIITVQSVNDSIACGSSASPGICTANPGQSSQDLHAYFHNVTSTGFQAYLSAMSGVWVGASSPAFNINYIVACD